MGLTAQPSIRFIEDLSQAMPTPSTCSLALHLLLVFANFDYSTFCDTMGMDISVPIFVVTCRQVLLQYFTFCTINVVRKCMVLLSNDWSCIVPRLARSAMMYTYAAACTGE